MTWTKSCWSEEPNDFGGWLGLCFLTRRRRLHFQTADWTLVWCRRRDADMTADVNPRPSDRVALLQGLSRSFYSECLRRAVMELPEEETYTWHFSVATQQEQLDCSDAGEQSRLSVIIFSATRCILYTSQRSKNKDSIVFVQWRSCRLHRCLCLQLLGSLCVQFSLHHCVRLKLWSFLGFSSSSICREDEQTRCWNLMSGRHKLPLLSPPPPSPLSPLSHHALPLFLRAVPPFLLIHADWKVWKLQQLLHISHNHDVQDPFFSPSF